jgi:hypothetical protein
MDQMEKVRLDQTKQLKMQDDQMNLSNFFLKKQQYKAIRQNEKKSADQLPFYERLREKSNVLEEQAR